MTKGVSSPRTRYLENSMLVMTAARMPKIYRATRIGVWYSCSKNVPTIMMYSGRRAEHDINGRMSIVIRRERWLSTVRVAMMAGTLHPKPIIRGMNDLP